MSETGRGRTMSPERVLAAPDGTRYDEATVDALARVAKRAWFSGLTGFDGSPAGGDPDPGDRWRGVARAVLDSSRWCGHVNTIRPRFLLWIGPTFCLDCGKELE